MSNILVEYRFLDKAKVITEGTGRNKRVKVRGVYQRADEENNNGRVYPRKVLEGQVKALQGKINERSLVGALDHPTNDAIHLSQASHLITKLWMEGNEVYGESEILSTPMGKVVEALLNDGVKIGISSRGMGTVSEARTVNEDFKLLTFDLVSDPSTRAAYPSIAEATDYDSKRIKKIISDVKSSQVFLTALESKIDEKLGRTDEGLMGGRRGRYLINQPKPEPTPEPKPEPKPEPEPKPKVKKSFFKKKKKPLKEETYDKLKDKVATDGGDKAALQKARKGVKKPSTPKKKSNWSWNDNNKRFKKEGYERIGKLIREGEARNRRLGTAFDKAIKKSIDSKTGKAAKRDGFTSPAAQVHQNSPERKKEVSTGKRWMRAHDKTKLKKAVKARGGRRNPLP